MYLLLSLVSLVTGFANAQKDTVSLVDEQPILCEYNNRTYATGETWYVENFLFQCQTHTTGWKADIISCMWGRTNETLSVGESKRYRKWSARCYREGDTVKWEERELNVKNGRYENVVPTPVYPEGLECVHDEQSFRPNQEWEVGNFVLKCAVSFQQGKWTWDVKITGCKWPRNGVWLKLEETKIVGVHTAQCYQDLAGTVKFEETESLPVQAKGEFEIKSTRAPQPTGSSDMYYCNQDLENPCVRCPESGCNETVDAYYSAKSCDVRCKSVSCLANGKIMKMGEMVTEGQFQYKCSRMKDVKVSACITDNKTPLPIGKVEVLDGVLHQCIEFNGQAFYRTETFIAESSKSTLFQARPPVEPIQINPRTGSPGSGAPASSEGNRPGSFEPGVAHRDSFFGANVSS